MEKLLKLRQERAEAIQKMKSLLDKAEAEKRDLNEAENIEYNATEVRTADLEKEIQAEETRQAEKKTRQDKLSTRVASLSVVETHVQLPNGIVTGGDPANSAAGNSPDSGFRNFGEFLNTIAYNRFDERLQRYGDPRQRLVEGRVQQMGVGAMGGFMVPEQFSPQILQVSPQEAIVRPRATIIPAGDMPDAKFSISSLDQTAARNIYGGVTVYHQGEKSTLTETSAYLKQISFEPKKMTGYMICTNDLLANWTAASGFCTTQMRLAMVGSEDYDFLRGDGANKALGIINAPCSIVYSRATASTIVYNDIIGMLARVKFGGPLVWITSQTTIPQLAALVDPGNNVIFVKSAAENMPSTLMGFPIIYSERNPVLGTKGDLMLCQLSMYMIKNGSGPRVDVSTDVLFATDQTAFRIVWHVDGQPWLTAPLPLEGSSSSTISPFVILE